MTPRIVASGLLVREGQIDVRGRAYTRGALKLMVGASENLELRTGADGKLELWLNAPVGPITTQPGRG